MKRYVPLLFVIILVLSLCGCKEKKKINRADYDEGPAIDAGVTSEESDYIEGDPYGNSEIGLTRAYDNIIIAFGDYDESLKMYTKYEYVKDVTYNGNACYLYSRLTSKTVDGIYKHHDYLAVYKDGSMIEVYKG